MLDDLAGIVNVTGLYRYGVNEAETPDRMIKKHGQPFYCPCFSYPGAYATQAFWLQPYLGLFTDDDGRTYQTHHQKQYQEQGRLPVSQGDVLQADTGG